jgi:DNA-binding response OmpR family regulator
MGSSTPALIAIQLAVEGVPLRAIARAVGVPATELRQTLWEAKNAGQIINLPCEDWLPPGCPRDQRALQLSQLIANNQKLAHQTVMQAFDLTLTQAKLLMLLLRHAGVSRQLVEMDGNLLDVHVFHLRRKLKPFGVAIETLWGDGYQLTPNNRRKVTELVLAAMST